MPEIIRERRGFRFVHSGRGGLRLSGKLAAGVLGMSLAWPATAQSPAPDPAAVALNCRLCHTQSAKSENPIPKLIGRPQAELEMALLQFKTDQRSGTIMNRIAKGYSDETIAALAAHLANLK